MRFASTLLLVLGTASALSAAAAPEAAADAERARAIHVLNRAAFGPTPESIDEILATNARSWIEKQLSPRSIDDAASEARLKKYPILHQSDAAVWETYYQPVLNARRERKREAGMEVDATPAGVVKGPRKSRMAARPQQVVQQLALAKLDRAIHSERQFEEVMVDFWLNHFNVFAGKSFERVLIGGYERDTIRPHAFGRFEDLLMATAKSPAMLVYLDNARSAAAPGNRQNSGPARGRTRKQAATGLNENYARELLELHTLGVGGGYSQTDVTELARALTGWTLERDRSGVRFRFRAGLHDVKPKKVLNIQLDGKGGIEEGEMLIRKLALHPSTARFLSRKLATKFISENPPEELIARVSKRYLESGGDIRESLRALLLSDEFLGSAHARTKIKTPFEYVVSAIRAAGRPEVDLRTALVSLRQMGQPLYFAQPPTGYSEGASDWVTSSGLVERMNFAVALAARSAPPTASADLLARQILGVPLSRGTLETLEKKVQASPGSRNLTLALVLGSPEFQRQ